MRCYCPLLAASRYSTLMPKRRPNRPKRASSSLLPLILTLGDTQDWRLPLGPWDWLHPVPRRVSQLTEREQTAQKMRKEEESRKMGAHQPPLRSNSPFRLHCPSQDAESTQIHWTAHQTGQPQMAWQGRYEMRKVEAHRVGVPHHRHKARCGMRPTTPSLPSLSRALADNIKQVFLVPCYTSQNICNHEILY